MFKLILSASLAGLMLSTAAFAGVEDKVSKINVTIDMTAVTNKAAALRYSNIVDDLTDAITAVLVKRIDTVGMVLDIDLSEVELSNSYTEVVGTADTRLVGSVTLSDAADNSNYKGFELTIDVNQARTLFAPDLDVTTLTAGSDVYYQAMINAFATNVVMEMDK